MLCNFYFSFLTVKYVGAELFADNFVIVTAFLSDVSISYKVCPVIGPIPDLQCLQTQYNALLYKIEMT